MLCEWRPVSRRTFGRMLGVLLLAAPSTAVAQGATVVRRIGALELNEPDPPEFLWKQAEPLRKLGWVEGQNLHVERRYANNRVEALQALAEELVRARVELIVTGGTPATLAAKRATNTLPIVIRTAGDPVREFEHTCRSLRLDPVFAAIAASGEIEGAVAQLARQHVQALMLRGGEFYDYRYEIAPSR